MYNFAPIVLFVYDRPEHTRLTLDYLINNDFANKSKLYVFADGAKNEKDAVKVAEVRNYIKSIKGFASVEVTEREKNYGLANSIISGINVVMSEYDRVIVMEDDMISSPYFLKYMNNLLNFYEEDLRICSVTGYSFPIKIPRNYKYDLYLSPRASSWGWGTWKNRWENVDWKLKDYDEFIRNKKAVNSFNKGGVDLTRMLKNQKAGKIDSWSIIWTYNHFKNNSFCIYPIESRIKNIGADLSGIHTNKTRKYEVALSDKNTVRLVKDIQPDKILLENFRKFFRKNFINSIYNRIKKLQK